MAVESNSQIKHSEIQAFGIPGFFKRVIQTTKARRPNILLVCHAIGSLPPFLDALSTYGNIDGLLVKPKSAQDDVLRRISRFYQIEILSRTVFASPYKTQALVDRMTGGQETVVSDIGGYFCNVPTWRRKGYLQNIAGIVEDTENGHQRYERADLTDLPIVSVARSETKRLEDWWVGRAIVFSAERQLRGIRETFNAKKITVLGFGKIGSSIADTLARHGYNVSVYDIDPCRRVQAKSMNYSIPNRAQAIGDADIIFSATGNHALSLDDLRTKWRPARIFSTTSADDEFAIDFSKAIKAYSEFWHFPCTDRRGLHLFANRGNAVNFLDGGEIGHYAHMVQSAIMHGIDAIMCGEFIPGRIADLSAERERLIASAYIREFEGI